MQGEAITHTTSSTWHLAWTPKLLLLLLLHLQAIFYTGESGDWLMRGQDYCKNKRWFGPWTGDTGNGELEKFGKIWFR